MLNKFGHRVLKIKNELTHFQRQLHDESGYKEVKGPMILDKERWKRFGHCKYSEGNLYFFFVDKRDFFDQTHELTRELE